MKILKEFFDKNMSSIMLVSFLFYTLVEGASMTVFSTFDSVDEVPKWFRLIAGGLRSFFICWLEFAVTFYAVRKWENALEDGKLTVPEIFSGLLSTAAAVGMTWGIFVIALLGFRIIEPTEDIIFNWNWANLTVAPMMTLILIIGSVVVAFFTVLFRNGELKVEKAEKDKKVKNSVKDHNRQQLFNLRNNKNNKSKNNQNNNSGNKNQDLINKAYNEVTGDDDDFYNNMDGQMKKNFNRFIGKAQQQGKKEPDIIRTLKYMLNSQLQT